MAANYQSVPTEPALEAQGHPHRRDPRRFSQRPYHESNGSRMCKIFCVIPTLLTLVVLSVVFRSCFVPPSFTADITAPLGLLRSEGLVDLGGDLCKDADLPWVGRPRHFEIDPATYTGFAFLANASNTNTDITYIYDGQAKNISITVDALLSHDDLQEKLHLIPIPHEEMDLFAAVLSTDFKRTFNRCIKANVTIRIPRSVTKLAYLSTEFIQGSLTFPEDLSEIEFDKFSVRSIAAPINVSGVRATGNVTVGSVDGAVTLNDATFSSLDLETVNGAIEGTDLIGGALEVQTTSGAIRIGSVRAGYLTAGSTSGVISFGDARVIAAKLTTVSGPLSGRYMVNEAFFSKSIASPHALTVRFPDESRAHTASIRGESLSGDVSIETEVDFAGELDVRSVTGRAIVDGPTDDVTWDKVDRGKREGVKGEGSGEVELYSFSGVARLAFIPVE